MLSPPPATVALPTGPVGRRLLNWKPCQSASVASRQNGFQSGDSSSQPLTRRFGPQIVLALVAAAAADVSHLFGAQHHHHHHEVPAPVVRSFDAFPGQYQKPIAILRQVQDNSGLGDYKYAFETENGIQVQEEAVLKNAGSKDEAKSAQGSYSYTGPDGQVYTVNWVADENGYRASGAHLPVAPEIPAEIQRSLEFNAAQPQQFDQQF